MPYLVRHAVATELLRYNNHDMSRVCIYPKDLCKPLRIGERQAQRKIKQARDGLKKAKHQYLKIKEFCEYMGLPEELFKDLK